MSDKRRYYYLEGGGVTFIDPEDEANKWHSYDDFGLIYREGDIPLPEPRTEFIEIPYRDGALDLSAPYGEEYVTYGDRILSLTFTTMTYRQEFMARFARLAKKILGRRMKVILDKDPNYYYIGRVTSFSPVEVAGDTATSTVTVEVGPYRYSIYTANDRWKWDPFNFYTDMALDMGSYVVNGTLTKTINVGESDVYPTFTVDSDMTLEFEGKTYQLRTGTITNYDIRLRGGVPNVLTFTGNGTVTIDYRGGRF